MTLAQGNRVMGNRVMIVLAYPDTCPFPTPASPRYNYRVGLYRVGLAVSGVFPGQSHFRRKWDRLGQNGTEKTFLLKIPGPVPRRFRGDKTGHSPDISGQTPDRNPQPHAQMSRNVLFCPVFSAFSSPYRWFLKVRPKTPANIWAVSMRGTMIVRRSLHAIAPCIIPPPARVHCVKM